MTDKQKNISLLIGFVLLLILSYFFSIRLTFDKKTALSKLEKDKELLSNAEEKIVLLKKENFYLDSILSKKELSIKNSFQQIVLNKINNFKKEHNAEIISFKEPHVFTQEQTKQMTYSFEIRADFNTLLKLTNYLERQQLGNLVSTNFEKKRNYRRNRQELIGKFFIEKLSQLN